jgi:hypothetical protein
MVSKPLLQTHPPKWPAQAPLQVLNPWPSRWDNPFWKSCLGRYILWKAQVLTAALGARRSGFLDRAALAPSKTIQVEQVVKIEENPMYASWYAQDQ